MEPEQRKRFAFIDVSNTKSTTKSALGFSVDWTKLYELLINEKWGCKKIFYYEGSMADTKRYEKRHKKLEKIGYLLKTKQIFLHKTKEKNVRFVCQKCSEPNTSTISNAKFICNSCEALNDHTNSQTHAPKANFDVEISVDTLEYAGSDVEFILFTGDGDFRYLAERLLEKGSLVTLVSTAKQAPDGSHRLSTRLKDLIAEEEFRSKTSGAKTRIRLIEIDNWKNSIKKTPRSATFSTDRDIIQQ